MANPLGSTPRIIVGVGVGAAASAALEPAIEIPKQEAWARNPNKVLDAGLMARLVAEGGVSLGAGQAAALRTGYSNDRFNALVYLAQTVPDLALVLELWRRGKIDPALVDHALTKEAIDTRYWDALKELFNARLSPADVAVMIQRTILANPGILPNQPSADGSNVPPMPQVDLDPIVEARAFGFDEPRLAALARIVGLPASPDLAARMHFRDIITEGAFNQAILEGNTRGEWAPFLLEGFREILTAGQYAELELRGYYDRATRLKNTAKHGMSDTDSDLLYNVQGRSIPVHAITTGEARGGVYNGPFDAIPEAYLHSLQRGNLRPEYYNLAYANRYSYPSAFVIRALATSGEIDGPTTLQTLKDIGWPPDLAEKVVVAWTGGTTAGADKHVTKAETQLWTTVHRSYIAEEITDTDATAALPAAGVAADAIPAVLATWQVERALIRRQLSAAQVKKAYREQVTNPATGAPWTLQDAITALLARGYDQADAQTFLAE